MALRTLAEPVAKLRRALSKPCPSRTVLLTLSTGSATRTRSAEVLLDPFRGLLRLVGRIRCTGPRVDHLRQGLGHYELPAHRGGESALTLRDSPPVEGTRACRHGLQRLRGIDVGQQCLLVDTGLHLGPRVGVLLGVVSS